MISPKLTAFLLVLLLLLFFEVTLPAKPQRDLATTQVKITGGEPNISGSLGGSVTKFSHTTKSLGLIANFGELSPINPNRLVKVVVPITIQSNFSYKLVINTVIEGNSQVIKLSDIGFGIQNLYPVGALRDSKPTIYSQFENDPTSIVNFNKGRAKYQASLADVSYRDVILTGSATSKESFIANSIERSWCFDAIFVITPQFYPPGQFNITFTFSLVPQNSLHTIK